MAAEALRLLERGDTSPAALDAVAHALQSLSGRRAPLLPCSLFFNRNACSLARLLALAGADADAYVRVALTAMRALESGVVAGGKPAAQLVDAVARTLDAAPAAALAPLCLAFPQHLKDGTLQAGASLELLPRLLGLAAALPAVLLDDAAPSGRAFAADVVHRLCVRAWPRALVARLCAVLREAPLEPAGLAAVVAKTLASMRALDVEETPPAVYQLLLCSIRGPKRAILQGLLDHHAWLEAQHGGGGAGGVSMADDDTVASTQQNVTGDRLRPVEGTVILHVTFAIQQDQELGKELLRLLKQAPALSSFAVALVLSVARTHRYEDAILDMLKVCPPRSPFAPICWAED